jgi:hypothetical protein
MTETTKKKTGFFAIDRKGWGGVCSSGLNCSVAYLVLAQGSGRNNANTSWSTNAVEKYTSISRHRAKAAIKRLITDGHIKQLQGGTTPKYEICHNEEPDWIWLPNQIVVGTVGEMPPVERIRQNQDVMALRLFVDLYHSQHLREDGGISSQIVWEAFERKRIGQQAQYVVWGFSCDRKWLNWNNQITGPHKIELTKKEKAAGASEGEDFWRRFNLLVSLGLVEMIPHLMESESPEAEIIHPYRTSNEDGIERDLCRAAHQAAWLMLTEGQQGYVEDKGYYLAPVPAHIANVEMRGIFRLRYRPHTKATGAWWADLHSKGEVYLQKYQGILEARSRVA